MIPALTAPRFSGLKASFAKTESNAAGHTPLTLKVFKPESRLVGSNAVIVEDVPVGTSMSANALSYRQPSDRASIQADLRALVNATGDSGAPLNPVSGGQRQVVVGRSAVMSAAEAFDRIRHYVVETGLADEFVQIKPGNGGASEDEVLYTIELDPPLPPPDVE